MFCPNCGSELNEGAAFCPCCGKKITDGSKRWKLLCFIFGGLLLLTLVIGGAVWIHGNRENTKNDTASERNLGGNSRSNGVSVIEDSVADQYAKQIYEEEFGNATDGAVLLITETENWKEEYETFACGSAAEPLIRQYIDEFWTLFDENYQDDVARQITATLYEVVRLMSENGETAISDSDLDYRGQKFIEDNINAFDSEGTLADAMEDFYESTGIRLYVIAEKYDSYGK